MICSDCKAELVSKNQLVPTYIGSYIVESNAQVDACPNCDYYTIVMSEASLLELHAVQIVLHEAEKIDGAILKFARKAAGFTKAELAKRLQLSVLIIEQYETDQLNNCLRAYSLALAGLLSYAELSLLGQNFGYIKKDKS